MTRHAATMTGWPCVAASPAPQHTHQWVTQRHMQSKPSRTRLSRAIYFILHPTLNPTQACQDAQRPNDESAPNLGGKSCVQAGMIANTPMILQVAVSNEALAYVNVARAELRCGPASSIENSREIQPSQYGGSYFDVVH